MIRAVASTASYDEAVGLLGSVPHASGQNYVIGSTTAVGCFESAIAARASARIARAMLRNASSTATSGCKEGLSFM